MNKITIPTRFVVSQRIKDILYEKIAYKFSYLKKISSNKDSKEIILSLKNDIQKNELKKLIDTINYELVDLEKLERFSDKRIYDHNISSDSEIYHTIQLIIDEHFRTLPKIKNIEIYKYDTGLRSVSKEVQNLRLWFNTLISDVFYELFHSTQFNVPDLISTEFVKRSGYFKTSSQMMYFVGEVSKNSHAFDNYISLTNSGALDKAFRTLSNSNMVLNPAVCLQLYPLLENNIMNSNEVTCFDLTGKAFRDEGGKFNFSDRLREFEVHEIVFFGTSQQLKDIYPIVVLITEMIFDKLNIQIENSFSNDIFFGPQDSNYLFSQMVSDDKLEFTTLNSKVSVASINKHKTKFTDEYAISTDNTEKMNSFCLAFGVDRFLSVYMELNGENYE